MVYTIGQNYPQKGEQFTLPFTMTPYQKLRFDLYNGNPGAGIPGLREVGYPEGLNSEGHIDILTDQSMLLQPSVLIANRDYGFTVIDDYGE